MKIFRLPDLGEGLTDAEIRSWHVEQGASVKAGDMLVSVETAKAVVDIPAPWDGVVEKLFVSADAVVEVGAPIIGFRGEDREQGASSDVGAIVGELKQGEAIVTEQAQSISRGGTGFKATPAVRALARKHDVDLGVVTPTGPDGLITARDVERVARILGEAGPLELLRGPRRAMAKAISQAHTEVANVTVTEDADLHRWYPGQDVTLRLIRAIVAGCAAEPALNAWYDAHSVGRRVLETIHLGVALDTADGLFVPVLRDVGARSEHDLREALERVKDDVRSRSIPPEEMRGYTITLSNFGVFGGRYANPMVMPPTVAILGAGAVREQVVAHNGKPVVHPVMPVSLSFDHRAVTGGEATRFLVAVIASLESPEGS